MLWDRQKEALDDKNGSMHLPHIHDYALITDKHDGRRRTVNHGLAVVEQRLFSPDSGGTVPLLLRIDCDANRHWVGKLPMQSTANDRGHEQPTLKIEQSMGQIFFPPEVGRQVTEAGSEAGDGWIVRGEALDTANAHLSAKQIYDLLTCGIQRIRRIYR